MQTLPANLMTGAACTAGSPTQGTKGRAEARLGKAEDSWAAVGAADVAGTNSPDGPQKTRRPGETGPFAFPADVPMKTGPAGGPRGQRAAAPASTAWSATVAASRRQGGPKAEKAAATPFLLVMQGAVQQARVVETSTGVATSRGMGRRGDAAAGTLAVPGPAKAVTRGSAAGQAAAMAQPAVPGRPQAAPAPAESRPAVAARGEGRPETGRLSAVPQGSKDATAQGAENHGKGTRSETVRTDGALQGRRDTSGPAAQAPRDAQPQTVRADGASPASQAPKVKADPGVQASPSPAAQPVPPGLTEMAQAAAWRERMAVWGGSGPQQAPAAKANAKVGGSEPASAPARPAARVVRGAEASGGSRQPSAGGAETGMSKTTVPHRPVEETTAAVRNAATSVVAAASTPAAQAVGAPASPPTPFGQASDGTPAPVLADQLVESLRAGAAGLGRQVTVHLEPPELGRVRITFRTEGEEVHGVLEVENSSTRAKLEREVAPLVQRLQDAGVQLRRLDVVSSDPQSTQGRPFAESNEGRGGYFGDEQLTGAAGESGAAPDGGGESMPRPGTDPLAADTAINVWI